MTTFATIKGRIADDIARSDLGNQISDAVLSAIAHYESERFYFNDSRSVITFSTIINQPSYGAAENSYLPGIVRVDALFLEETNITPYPLERYTPVDLEMLSPTTTGKPTAFSHRTNIRLWPKPNAVYTMRVHGVYRLTTLSSDTDSNDWLTDAEELIRSAAKRRLYGHVLRDFEGATAMAMAEQECLSRLRAETSMRTGIGKIIPVAF